MLNTAKLRALGVVADRRSASLPEVPTFAESGVPGYDVSGFEDDVKRLRKIMASDENASNIAELGIGTSHTIPRVYRATRRDGAMSGNVHIAVGRNNDIGGQTWSGTSR